MRATGQVRLLLPEHVFKKVTLNVSGMPIILSGGFSNRFLSFPELTQQYICSKTNIVAVVFMRLKIIKR